MYLPGEADSLKNECAFSERLYGKIHCWRLRRCIACGPRQCLVNDLNAVFFLPSLVFEDRQWIQSLSELSWVVAMMPLYSLGTAARLVELWIPACPDIANLFFQLHHPSRRKVAVQFMKCAIKESETLLGRWGMKDKIKENWICWDHSPLFFEIAGVWWWCCYNV